MGRRIRYSLMIGSAVIAGFAMWRAWYGWEHPYGDRTCMAPCTMSALRLYSHRNENWYPRGGSNSVDALRELFPIYLDAAKLAGLSGDIDAVKKLLRDGYAINDTVSSWVYWPGFRNDDPSELAIIWERSTGVSGIGTRSTPGSRIVGYANGMYDLILENEWNAFLERQQTLRSNILSRRSVSEH